MNDTNTITIEIKAIASDFASIFQELAADIQKLNTVIANCNAALKNLAASFTGLNQKLNGFSEALNEVSTGFKKVQPVNPQVPRVVIAERMISQENRVCQSLHISCHNLWILSQMTRIPTKRKHNPTKSITKQYNLREKEVLGLNMSISNELPGSFGGGAIGSCLPGSM